MTPSLFSTLFIVALLLSTATKLWLARRQLKHVIAHRGAVPAAFQDKIDLTAHQKAADYTSTKTRFSLLSIVFEAGLLLAFTLGGGIQ